MQGHGIKIGGSNTKKEGEWRCKICKFLNTAELERCGMCREAK